MSFKTKIIIAIVLAVLIIVVGFVFYSRQQKQLVNNGGQNGGSTTGEGGFTEVPPGPVFDGRGNLIVKTDPTQPFVALAPRAAEPQPTTGGGNSGSGPQSNFKNYNQALADGLIPDKNGLYNQTVDPSGFNTYDRTAYNYSLPEDQFITKYYGSGTVNDIVNDATPADIAANNEDPLLISNSSSQQTQPISVVSGVDASMFQQNGNNAASYQAYIKQLSDATKPFDVIHDSATMSGLFDTSSDSTLNSYKQKAQQIRDAIKNIAVPSNMLGLSEAYYAAYDDYLRLVDSMIVMNDGSDPDNSDQNFAAAYSAYTNMLDEVQSDIESATALVRSASNA